MLKSLFWSAITWSDGNYNSAASCC